MRVPINIASRPADLSRPLRAVAAALGCLALLLSFVAVRSELRSRNEFRELVDRNNQLGSDIGNLQNTQKEMQVWLETPQVTQIRQRSALLNSLISQKSLSWTRMFQDLEAVLPAGVRITGIAPVVKAQGAGQSQPELRLSVAAREVGPIVTFIKRLEDSSQFANPVVAGQRYPGENEEDGDIKVTLATYYVQSLSTPPAAGSEASVREEEGESAAAVAGPKAESRLPAARMMAAGGAGAQSGGARR